MIATANEHTIGSQVVSPGRWLRRHVTTTGIDLGGHTAKLIVRTFRRGRWRVTIAARRPVPPASPNDTDAWAEWLAGWLRDESVPRSSRLIANVPSAMVDYETVLAARRDGEETETVAARELQGLLGNAFTKVAADFWRTDPTDGDDAAPLHLAWTDGDFVSGLAHSLDRRGWRVHVIDIPAMTLARVGESTDRDDSRRRPNEQPKERLVADVAGGQLTSVWGQRSIPKYVRHAIRFHPVSAPELLAESINVSPDAAVTLLRSWGFGEPASEPMGCCEAMICGHLRPWLESLSFELLRTAQYLRHEYGPSAVGEIVLCGGGAGVRGLAARLAELIGLPVRDADVPGDWAWESASPYTLDLAQAIALTRYVKGDDE